MAAPAAQPELAAADDQAADDQASARNIWEVLHELFTDASDAVPPGADALGFFASRDILAEAAALEKMPLVAGDAVLVKAGDHWLDATAVSISDAIDAAGGGQLASLQYREPLASAYRAAGHALKAHVDIDSSAMHRRAPPGSEPLLALVRQLHRFYESLPLIERDGQTRIGVHLAEIQPAWLGAWFNNDCLANALKAAMVVEALLPALQELPKVLSVAQSNWVWDGEEEEEEDEDDASPKRNSEEEEEEEAQQQQQQQQHGELRKFCRRIMSGANAARDKFDAVAHAARGLTQELTFEIDDDHQVGGQDWWEWKLETADSSGTGIACVAHCVHELDAVVDALVEVTTPKSRQLKERLHRALLAGDQPEACRMILAEAPLIWASVPPAPERKGVWSCFDVDAALSPLMLACSGGQEATVELLLSPPFKASALIGAARARQEEVRSDRWLASSGAVTPIHRACTPQIVKKLLACVMTEEEEESFLAELDFPPECSETDSLADDKQQLNDDDYYHFTRSRFGIDAYDLSNRTPLHTARSSECAFALLAAGADPWAVTDNNEWPAETHAQRADRERAQGDECEDGSISGSAFALNMHGKRDRAITTALQFDSIAAAIDAWVAAETLLVPRQQLAWAEAATDPAVPISADLVEMVGKKLCCAVETYAAHDDDQDEGATSRRCSAWYRLAQPVIEQEARSAHARWYAAAWRAEAFAVVRNQLAPLEKFLRTAKTFDRGQELGGLVGWQVAGLLCRCGVDGDAKAAFVDGLQAGQTGLAESEMYKDWLLQ
eukprot:SAG31_NODE_1087_length_9993_cov_13.126440_2_plen_784_part_00